MDGYIERHRTLGEYVACDTPSQCYESVYGWTDHRIGPHIVFAHRATDYTSENFRDALHVHDYCEVLFWYRGDVQYVSGDRTEDPRAGSVIVIPPGELHTTRLLGATHYDRYVIYFSRDAFSDFGGGWDAYLSEGARSFATVIPTERRAEIYGKLREAEARLTRGDASATVGAYALVIEVLLLLGELYGGGRSKQYDGAGHQQYLPEPIRAIRRYIDENYSTITSVEEVASRFYYTREYVTRLFRRYYNLSPGDYIEQCRIREAEKRIAGGEKIADVCYAVGYRSVSAFSAAFRRVTGKNPSAFRRR